MATKNNVNEYKILMVDDDQEVLDNYTLLLESFDYNVTKCLTGQEAISITRKGDIDIILMDYYMMGMNGEQAIKEIRKFNKEVVIILQTAFSGEKPALEMLSRLNIQGYHDKSTGIEDLLLWIASAIKIREQSKEIQTAYNTIKNLKDDITANIISSFEKPLESMLFSMSSIKDCTKYLKSNIGDVSSLKIQHNNLDRIGSEIDFLNTQRAIMNEIKLTLEETLQKTMNMAFKFSINELLRKIKTTAQYMNKHRHYLNIVVKFEEEIFISGNINELLKVLVNLLMSTFNAYGESEGVIDFIISKDGDNVVFKISDYINGFVRYIETTDIKILSAFGSYKNTDECTLITIPIVNIKEKVKVK